MWYCCLEAKILFSRYFLLMTWYSIQHILPCSYLFKKKTNYINILLLLLITVKYVAVLRYSKIWIATLWFLFIVFPNSRRTCMLPLRHTDHYRYEFLCWEVFVCSVSNAWEMGTVLSLATIFFIITENQTFNCFFVHFWSNHFFCRNLLHVLYKYPNIEGWVSLLLGSYVLYQGYPQVYIFLWLLKFSNYQLFSTVVIILCIYQNPLIQSVLSHRIFNILSKGFIFVIILHF